MVNASVLIVGAGAAGWAAAKDLIAQGVQVLMLEARSRIGGRIYTKHTPSYPIDLGAEFVHGAAEEIPSMLSEGAIKKLTESHMLFWRGQREPLVGFWEKIAPVLEKMKCHNVDRSVAAFVQEHSATLNEREIAMLIDYLEGFNASDIVQMSECAMASENAAPGVNDNSRVVSGYDSIFDCVREIQASPRFELLLNSELQRIEWKRGEIKAVSGARTDYAEAAILTVPASVIARQEMQFLPDLPSKVEAAGRIEMGPVYKVVFLFRTPPWSASLDIDFLHTPEMTFGTRWLWGIYDSKILVSWSGGSRALTLAGKSHAEIVGAAMADLSKSLSLPGGQLEAAIESAEVHDWQADQYAGGAYSYVRVGGRGAREELAKSVKDTLFFAGEATMSDGSAGTVHGALRSGRRAAREALQALA